MKFKVQLGMMGSSLDISNLDHDTLWAGLSVRGQKMTSDIPPGFSDVIGTEGGPELLHKTIRRVAPSGLKLNWTRSQPLPQPLDRARESRADVTQGLRLHLLYDADADADAVEREFEQLLTLLDQT